MSRLIVSTFFLVAFAAIGSYSLDAEAAPPDKCSPWPECKDGGEDPPSVECVDVFPDFAFGRNGEIWLSSTCGYRAEKVADQGIAPQLHLYPDEATGLTRGAVYYMLNSDDMYRMYRAAFKVDENGSLVLLGEQQVLPASGETAPDQQLYYFTNPSIWGDPASSNAYWTTVRYVLAADGTEIADWMLYQFDESGFVDSRLLLENAWDEAALTSLTADGCEPYVLEDGYPHQVPACYALAAGSSVDIHPAGTHFYIEGRQGRDEAITGSELWQSTMRMEIVNRDSSGDMMDLADWQLDEPRMVYIGTYGIGSSPDVDDLHDNPSGSLVRPRVSASDPEQIGLYYYDHTGRHTFLANVILNVDTCIGKYDAYSDGLIEVPLDYWWYECIDTELYLQHLDGGVGNADRITLTAWQGPDSLLQGLSVSKGKNNVSDVYRRYIDGGAAGTSVLVLGNASSPDTIY